jgi:hypothetical protein
MAEELHVLFGGGQVGQPLTSASAAIDPSTGTDSVAAAPHTAENASN